MRAKKIASFLLAAMLTITLVGTMADPVSAATKKPGKPTIYSLDNYYYRYLAVYWHEVKDANGYQVVVGTNKSVTKGKKTQTIKAPLNDGGTFFQSLKPGEKYYAKVRAYKKSGKKKIYGSWSSVKSVKVKSRPATITKVKVSSPDYGQVVVDWDMRDWADKYEVLVGTNKSVTKGKKARTTSSSSVKFTSLQQGKKYYVKVRSYMKSGKKKVYSSWSSVKSVTVKKKPATTPTQPTTPATPGTDSSDL